MKPRPLQQILHRKRYDTQKGILLSGDDWWDGHNWERSGTNTFLYRSPRGLFFTLNMTSQKGAPDHIEAVSEAEAIALFETHAAHGRNRVGFEEAFPGVELQDA